MSSARLSGSRRQARTCLRDQSFGVATPLLNLSETTFDKLKFIVDDPRQKARVEGFADFALERGARRWSRCASLCSNEHKRPPKGGKQFCELCRLRVTNFW